MFFNFLTGSKMEFAELLLLTFAPLLILFKPEKEKLAWRLTVISWAVCFLIYLGHVSTAIFGVINV